MRYKKKKKGYNVSYACSDSRCFYWLWYNINIPINGVKTEWYKKKMTRSANLFIPIYRSASVNFKHDKYIIHYVNTSSQGVTKS